MIAVNNVFNAGFMVAGRAAAGMLAAIGMGAPAILRLLAVINLPVAVDAVGRWRRR